MGDGTRGKAVGTLPLEVRARVRGSGALCSLPFAGGERARPALRLDTHRGPRGATRRNTEEAT